MRVITDFHLHSRFSRACSKELTVRNIAKMCERKGIQFVGTSDFTHPAWREEIGRELEEDGQGAFRLRDGSSATSFLLSTELSCIYKRGDKVRRVHHIVLFPSLEAVDHLIRALEKRGANVRSDGRPILGIDSEELVKMVLDADPTGLLIPAHAWTPWFAVFGSQSGFDALEDCFGEMTKYITAIETGLSSDPKMNGRLSALDGIHLVSNSDAHSLDKLGREANVFAMEAPSYQALHQILTTRDTDAFLETIEFFPEEGKYHVDGHRACGFWCQPSQTKRLKGLCPKCGKPLTIGVLHRVDDLADRAEDAPYTRPVPFRSIIPLDEIIADVLGVGSSSKKVRKELDLLLVNGRSEFAVLLDIPEKELAAATTPAIAEAIMRVRIGEVEIRPGFDGEYGIISTKKPQEIDARKQQALFT